MSILFIRVGSWLGKKLILFGFIFLVLLVTFILTRLPEMAERHLDKELQRAQAQIQIGVNLVDEAHQHARDLSEEINSRKEELTELQKQLDKMNGFFAWVGSVFSSKEQEGKVAKLEEQVNQAEKSVRQAEDEYKDHRAALPDSEEAQRERERHAETLSRQREDLKRVREGVREFTRSSMFEIAKSAALILLALILLPMIWKVIAYHLLAPLVERSPPIQLSPQATPDASEHLLISESRPAERIALASGMELWVHPEYLQSSTDDSRKRTKWLLDWHYPFASLASGQVMLTSIRPIENTDEREVSVTISCQSAATTELAKLEIPTGYELAFRPSFLVGLVAPEGAPPRIRSRWVFGRLHAWVAMHFRYLIIKGPVTLLFAAQRGVQSEMVEPSAAGRRLNSELTIAFSPGLKYKPRRAETFVSYFRGISPLFDDFFTGHGMTFNQQVGGGPMSGIKRFRDGILNAFGKALGL